MQVNELFPLFGVLVAAFAAWWKIKTDTDAYIEAHHASSAKEIADLRIKVETVQSQSISRTEHEKDIERVREEIRAFRSEVRDDLKNLNATLTGRFDILMQRLTDPHQRQHPSSKDMM